MIKIFKKTIKDSSFSEVNKAGVGSWINIVNPSKEELENASTEYKMPLDLLEDAIDKDELPRIERENGSIFVYIRIPVEVNNEISTTPLTIAITPEYIITICPYKNEIISRFLDGQVNVYTTQKANFLINIFLQTIILYNRYIKTISKKVRSQKVNLRELKNYDIINLVENEEQLNNFASSLSPNINVFEKILSNKYIKLYERDQDLIEDLLVDAKQVLDLSQTNIRTITNVREAYSTILSNNINKILKFLASITIILTIPTMIASIYGMNVPLPYSDNPFAFTYIITFLFIIGFITTIIFYWRRWL